MTATTNDKMSSLELVYTEAKLRLDQQFEQIESLNTRASVLLGFLTVIMSITAGFAAVVPKGLKGIELRTAFALGAVLVLMYVATVLLLFLAYRVEDYRRDPEPGPLRDHYLVEEPRATMRVVLNNLVHSYELNKSAIDFKVKALRAAYTLFMIEAVYIVGVAALLAMWIAQQKP